MVPTPGVSSLPSAVQPVMAPSVRVRVTETSPPIPLAVPVNSPDTPAVEEGRLAAAAVAKQADRDDRCQRKRSHALANLILFHCFFLLILGLLVFGYLSAKKGGCSFGKQPPLPKLGKRI